MNRAKIDEIITRYRSSGKAALAIGFKDLKSGLYLSADDARPNPTASFVKVFLLAELLRQANAGSIDMNETVRLPKTSACEGSGILPLLHDGIEVTIHDLAVLMMVISDNTATDYLMERVGKDNIRENVIKPLELAETRADFNCRELLALYFNCGDKSLSECHPDLSAVQLRNYAPFLCNGGPNDQTSVRDAVKILESFYRGAWVSEAVSEECLKIMKCCQTCSRIPRYLPSGVAIAHKTGTIDRVAVDCGIVYTQKGDYILSMFYNGNISEEAAYRENHNGAVGDDTLAALSLEIYQAYIEEDA